jgi:Fanconi anemia group J protein
MAIDLSNSVVILDEAHNVEDTLREAGSCIFGELELYELVVMLNNYAITERSNWNLMEVVGMVGIVESATYLCDVAHSLLIIVEQVVNELREARKRFEASPGAKGAAGSLREADKFHLQDDTEFEITVQGPTGKYNNSKCIGCKPFFDNLGLSVVDFECATNLVTSLEKFLRGREGNDAPTERDRIQNLVDRLAELIHKLYAASQSSE